MRNRATALMVGAVGLAVVLGCGKLSELGNKVANSTVPTTPTKTFTLNGKEWRSYQLEPTDITIDLPGEPKDHSPQSSQLPPSYTEVFSSMRVFAVDDKDFSASATELVPTGKGKGKFSVKMLADTSMTAVKRQIPDLNYTVDVRSESSARIAGTYSRHGKSGELKGCTIYKKDNPMRVWEVLVLMPTDNADAQTAAQKILDSAAFKTSTENCR